METMQITPELLLRLNVTLSVSGHFSRNVEKALALLGEASRHDRIYIIEIHRNMTYTIAYAWHEKSLPDLPPALRHSKLAYAPALEQQLCEQNRMVIHDSDLPSYPDLAALLQASNCLQMLMLPLFGCGSPLAFISFVQCLKRRDWSEKEIKLLEDLAALVAVQMDNHYFLKQAAARFKQEKTIRFNLEIKQQRLHRWCQEVHPVWEGLKSRLEAQQVPEVAHLEHYFTNLEKICAV